MAENDRLDTLLAHQAEFRAFLASRLGNASEVDDLLQESLVKALRTADQVEDSEKVTAWFYQVLRRAMIDHFRSRQASRQREEAWVAYSDLWNDRDAERTICRCFEGLFGHLKPREAELLRRVELGGESVSAAAAALGISPNNASVVLHRARKSLREKLEGFCGSCTTDGSYDCTCDE